MDVRAPASRHAPVALVLAVVLGLAMFVAGSGPVFVVGDAYESRLEPSVSTTTPSPTSVVDPAAPTPPPPIPSPPEFATNGWVRLILGVLAGALVLAVLWRLFLMWRGRPREIPAPDVPPVEPVAEAVLDDADEQFAALRSGAPNNAIVTCWQRLEAAIDRAGCPALPWETPAEVTSAVLRRFEIDDDAIAGLADLYREARFSRHALGEADRERAVDALTRIHEGLAHARVPEAEQAP
ncbi:DUF4129 domain-containing protein [Nostocoides australiense]|nr:DUF4129 domain-containing protein [Tetrasphaera australiensis]